MLAAAGGWMSAIAWQSPTTTLALAALIVLLSAFGLGSSVGLERRERIYAFRAALMLATVLALPAALQLASTTNTWQSASLRLYEVGLVLLAAFMLWGLLAAPWRRVAVTDLVVELGEGNAPTLRDALARALGDPSLQVGYWLAEARTFVDSDGRPLELPNGTDGRSTTFVEREGEPAAVLVHDRAILSDPSLLEGVASATRLAAANARLQAELQVRVAEVAASRRRVLVAGDDERERLERRLREGAGRRLDELAQTLRAVNVPATSPLTDERVAHAESQLTRAIDELSRFADGIHPRELSERGLAAALTSLVAERPQRVQLDVPKLSFSPTLEACVYFTCSEALTNIAKYACAPHVEISITSTSEVVTVRVDDDGVGGADPQLGTGLRGLVDRVEALGGTLTFDSPPGAGTHLTAVLPANA
jgi:signal transduction histidine kinase